MCNTKSGENSLKSENLNINTFPLSCATDLHQLVTRQSPQLTFVTSMKIRLAFYTTHIGWSKSSLYVSKYACRFEIQVARVANLKLRLKSLVPVNENQHGVVVCLCTYPQYLQTQNLCFFLLTNVCSSRLSLCVSCGSHYSVCDLLLGLPIWVCSSALSLKYFFFALHSLPGWMSQSNKVDSSSLLSSL